VTQSKLAVEFDENKIDAIFADIDQCHLPGAAVGIAIGGKPIYRKGFGLASMELPVLLSPTIRLRIHSTTKHFTALAYMLLCEEGKAGIDDPIGKYLPELHPVTHQVTARQLMGNIGGLRDVHDICWQFSGTGLPVSTADLLSLYRTIDDANAAPGTAWTYNNGGWLMMSVAIERITGESLDDVLRQRIFEPVGMHDTRLRRVDSDFVPNSASMHMTNPAGGYEKSYLGGTLTGEAGMVSTVDDMLRWLAHMATPIVGSSATWETLKAPQRLINGASTHYGLGLQSDRYRGVETVFHPGGGMGCNSQMLKVPEACLDIVILVNREDISGILLVDKVLDACLPDLDPIKTPVARPLVTGIFRSPTTGRVIQMFGKQGQQIASIDGMDMPVEPDENGVLWPAGIYRYAKVAITLGGDSSDPLSIGVNDFGNVDELTREVPADEVDVAMIAGLYRSDTTYTEATISETHEGPQLKTIGRFGSTVYRLRCLSEGIWQAKTTSVFWRGGILMFDRDSRAFRFSTYRTRALTFHRDV